MDKTTMLECLINHFTDGNKAAFGRMLGIKPQTINSWLLRNSFDIDLIYSKCAGISAHWLLTGEGEMLVDLSASQTVSNSTNVFAIMDKKTMLECLINHFTDGNKAAFARMLNITPQVLSQWLGRSSFDNELLYRKCKGVSSHWLLTGEGDMLEELPRSSETNAEEYLQSIIKAKDDLIAALQQSLADKERLICNLIEARKQ